MTIALVCGGRWYGRVPFHAPREKYRELAAIAEKEAFMLRETLDELMKTRGLTSIIAGDAPGADDHAHKWAAFRRIPAVKFKAEWKIYGRSAGPIRNGRMLAEGRPDFVVAFTGGDGTADMIRQAKATGVEVLDYRDDG